MEINQILLDKNVSCTMRDGTKLYADIYRPNKEGTFPVLLTRIPYDKDKPFYSHRYLDTNKLVLGGYVVIVQDVRGRFNSEGEFYPLKNEAEDGYDTVEWAASLPYSTGKVGMFGLSYWGFTQLMAAIEQPPSLYAIFPSMTGNGRGNEGPFSLASSETMMLETFAPDLIKRKYKDPNEYDEKIKKLAKYYNHIQEWYRYAPIKDFPPLKDLDVAEFFFDNFETSEGDKAVEKPMIADQYDRFQIPAYHVAGWYDILLKPTLENFSGMREKAANDRAKNQQKLMIGPWAHSIFKSNIGERFFGIQASEDWIDLKESLTELHLRWFDQWLKEKNTSITDEAPVKLFVMGTNEWRDEQEWPLARTQYMPFYLHSDGGANTNSGNGRISWQPPADERADTYSYDPEHPVPTYGGATMFAGSPAPGPLDQRQIEERDDVLVYTSDPLVESLEVTGPVTLKLWVQTEGKSTDFAAKLVDVQPDGTAYNLVDGIVRLGSNQTIEDQVVACEVDLWSTSNVFLPGHCIRVDITSSNYPQFDPNLNTGSTMITSQESRVVEQKIYHQVEYPSHLLLPVITG